MSKREISLDTETTGFKPSEGHRLVEIGCVEMINRVPTGNNFHVYINPERDMPDAAFQVHGLSDEFLSDKPKFAEVAKDFVDFIGNDTLVIHNAQFDMRFLNAELTWAKYKEIPQSQAFCTLQEARKRFPGAPASLDALCKRFNIDNSARTHHGALLDAELLAEMYLELMGGSQVTMELDSQTAAAVASIGAAKGERREPRPHNPTDEEIKAHQAFMEKISQPLWNQG